MFLITTALEETWRDHEPVLFLGEWCRRFSRKSSWTKLNGKVSEYHWDDRTKLFADYKYLNAFQEKILADLTPQMNTIHGVHHQLRYWRILLGPWLGYFIPILFDRWTSIENAVKKENVTETVLLDMEDRDFIPNDMESFKQLILGDEWNHHVYSMILRRIAPGIRFLEAKPSTKFLSEKPNPENGSIFQNAMNWVSGLLTQNNDCFFISTYLSPQNSLKIQLQLGQRPQFWKPVAPVQGRSDQKQRTWVVEGESHSGFEKFVRELIPRQLPIAYLEGYADLVRQMGELHWPKSPDVIFTSNAHFPDDVFKVWAAEKTEVGSKLMIGQHGGHYGIGLWSFPEDHEKKISDAYLSWGWRDPENSRVRDVGMLKNKKLRRGANSDRSKALLVTTTVPRQSYYMFSAIMAGQWLEYFNDQCAFVESLNDEIRNNLVVRMYPYDYGWDQVSRWKERFPDLTLDEGHSQIDPLIDQSRIYISTYNATTFLESISMDVPTVIFWNPERWELRESAIPYFSELSRVGIFHVTPQSAADHIGKIWNDVDAWWKNPELRRVLHEFRRQYCHLPDNRLEKIAHTLQESRPVK